MASSDPQPFPADAIIRVESAASTMDEARALSRGRPRGAVMAGVQTAGRGRLPGRSWVSAPGESLLATAWLPAADFGRRPPSLVAGLALVLALEDWAAADGIVAAPPLRVRWPNDIVADGRKLAGILCESSSGTVYVGMGVNLAQEAFPGAFRTPPASLRLLYGAWPGAERLLGFVLPRLSSSAADDDWLDAIRPRLAFLDAPVAFMPGLGDREAVPGTFRGVDGDGAALVETPAGLRRFASGELRPAAY